MSDVLQVIGMTFIWLSGWIGVGIPVITRVMGVARKGTDREQRIEVAARQTGS